MTIQESEALIASLLNPDLYDHPVKDFDLIETHISWVLLTGEFAYKIKKPLNLGFLDFSTLQKRKDCCTAELRLNRRLAKDLYLDVVTITGDIDHPCLAGTDTPIEYAVKMRQFDQGALLSELARKNRLTAGMIDEAAWMTARFHERLPPAPAGSQFGVPDQIQHFTQENFLQISPFTTDEETLKHIEHVQAWANAERLRCDDALLSRKKQGMIRECHGDLHLGNLVIWQDKIQAFDCIEFNEALRWIDVMSETAFMVMDLSDRGHPELADRFLNTYLHWTGDYTGLTVLPYYLAYRAMVRAKVAMLRLSEGGLSKVAQAELSSEFHAYLKFANDTTRKRKGWLLITHGLSGAGKSTVAGYLARSLGAIQIRSDIERKRLFGYRPTDESHSGQSAGIYTHEANRKTYEQLAMLSYTIIDAGWPVIVDAAFLKSEQRAQFKSICRSLPIPFAMLSVSATDEVLRQRISQRMAKGDDASEAGMDILDRQMHAIESLTDEEAMQAIAVTGTSPKDLVHALEQVTRQLGIHGGRLDGPCTPSPTDSVDDGH
ncbi:MAG: bifunctional aminoglycoside phosphotransferase/ATP-binding protein [Gammaproteobacteria bacterium]|nr:MAG: bifunctional aminoglycoside phosphotransferase/ATP-binding protein [Gammaproteobacteria bacterium]